MDSYCAETGNLLRGVISGNPDFVLDCIDNIDSKVRTPQHTPPDINTIDSDASTQIELLVYCHQNKLPVFSALGAAAKSDPSRIQVR